MRIHFLIHEEYEQPAAIATWAIKQEHNLSYTRFYLGEKTPNDIDFDFLIIMGGPQSPSTSPEECSYFDGKKEIEFIKQTIENGKYVLGVCLGAQLISESYGAKTEKSPYREIGFFEIEFTSKAREDSLTRVFPQKIKVGHWHSDMPGLAENSTILASSKGCPRQIIRYSEKVYGFLCHLEFTPEAIEAMIKNNHKELKFDKTEKFIQNKNDLKAFDTYRMNAYLFDFLNKIEERFNKEL